MFAHDLLNVQIDVVSHNDYIDWIWLWRGLKYTIKVKGKSDLIDTYIVYTLVTIIRIKPSNIKYDKHRRAQCMNNQVIIIWYVFKKIHNLRHTDITIMM